MKTNPFNHELVWQIGPMLITRPVVTTWVVMVVMVALSWWVTRRLSVDKPGRVQTFAELMITTLRDEMKSTMRLDPEPFLPLIGTLFLFILFANLSGLLPGAEPPTAALETDLVLALAVFFAVTGWGVKRHGVWGYMKSYAQPNLFVLPLNLLEAVTRVLSMTVRLFGNIMSGMFISAVVLGLAGLLVPIPFMALDLLTGLIQAYIFMVLAMVFIAAAAGNTET
ncbi:F0F1 ATP synthase subunit A [Hydrogenophaga sp. PAMC20947]|uniref:F0F1 ATP synthase subunit A n=1 Tax=Hydrogenophaga sp. PAMC20947 TaxID=2565558 RepID=UPI00109E0670|nr:F0F1 ATP synthase subunit A [Hydrogenophaga sp. PAMC20947]QCB48146.1 F0F1 ATP synthase subunit A [Hydrogenophaga sp. PAMC20947]